MEEALTQKAVIMRKRQAGTIAIGHLEIKIIE
jgi:hypothetical protein